jgi:Protein O-mannosyl-transferase TMEM260-like
MSDKKSNRGAAANPRAPQDRTVAASKSGPAGTPNPVPPPVPSTKVKPLFRKIDWISFAVTALVVLIGYWWTLAPNLTLEDSGELATASMYAGVPHPPGYPVWTIYTWLFTVLFPVSNMAYRVAFSSAMAGALACGLVALMVSRGSSMMIEGISDLKQLDRRWENWICMVSGFVAGMLIGFNGFMWSQGVIVEVYTLSALSLAAVLVFLLRWIYAPHQRRYLYWAFFWFGISFNNHQSLLVVAIGLEVAVIVAAPRLGRDLVFWSVVVWLGGLVGKNMGLITTLSGNDPTQVNPLFIIYNLIGVSFFFVWIYLVFKTKMKGIEFARDLALVGSVGFLLMMFGVITNYVTFFEFKPKLLVLTILLGLGCIGTFGYLITQTTKFGREWLGALSCGGAWIFGAAFYLYMPLASMTNPPLNWGYPRTVQGFFHAFTRGQYERINPTTEVGRFIDQVVMYVSGAMDEFNLVYLVIGLVPFLFFMKMQKRERSWLTGLAAIYLCLSVFLLILLNPAPDRQSRDLNRVFFTASHVMIAMGIGYGLTLLWATLANMYERYRITALASTAVTAGVALFGVAWTYHDTFYWVMRFTSVLGLILAVAAVGLFLSHRSRAPLKWLLILFACMPLYSIFSHWSDNEQRGHLFGFWFGHDMFTPPFKGPDGKPIYPEMDRDTVLFGGTDPGRFNPTYMIFCDSFTPPGKKEDPNFDRRDVYLITQNALADGTYLNYIRAQYNRSAENDPLFFSELLRGPQEVQQNYKTNIVARMMLPIDRFFTRLGDRIEKRRRTYSSWFKEKDFKNLPALVAKLKHGPNQDPLSKFLFEKFSKETQALITENGKEDDLKEALAKEWNRLMENEYEQRQYLDQDLAELDRWAPTREDFRKRIEEKLLAMTKSSFTPAELTTLENSENKLQTLLGKVPVEDRDKLKKQYQEERIARYLEEGNQLYDTNRFKQVALTQRTVRFLKQSPGGHTLIRLDRILLEEAYPGLIAQSIGGVYPDLEIHCPSADESQKSFQEYLADAQKRLDHDRRFPNEPKQIKLGENVSIIENKVQVSGQVAVMAINGLLTKVIFNANPDHEFYVEESFPLDWMYPHLSPYGIIMKINRDPLPEVTAEMVGKDHDFWSQYSHRLIGNWITYDTTVSNICEFVERVYIRRDYHEFQGDPKFIRDSDAQKAFSKLRSSIGGVYNYRITAAKTPQEQQRMIKEAEFAFKQAYAFCPYSPEALFRFVQLLTSVGRVNEAQLLARTSFKLDPNNGQIQGLIFELEKIKRQRGATALPQPAPPPVAASQAPAGSPQLQAETAQLEALLQTQPSNVPVMMRLAQNYFQAQNTEKALQLLDRAVASPNADTGVLLMAVQKYNELNQLPKVAQALEKLVKVLPDNPEVWFDLAAVQITLNQPTQSLASLEESLQLSGRRLAANPKASNLLINARTDARFAPLRSLPAFQALLNSAQSKVP